MAAERAPIFSERYGSDQYGGLLAFNTFIYRYFSPDAQRPLMLVLLSAVSLYFILYQRKTS